MKGLGTLLKREIYSLFPLTTEFLNFYIQDKKQLNFENNKHSRIILVCWLAGPSCVPTPFQLTRKSFISGHRHWKTLEGHQSLKATSTFQRLMAQALTRVTMKYGNLVMCYVDDVVIATPTLEDHFDRLDEVFVCLKRACLKCKPSKCEILWDSIKYLGRMVDRHGVRPDPEAVEAVLTWKAPRTDTQLMSVLWFVSY